MWRRCPGRSWTRCISAWTWRCCGCAGSDHYCVFTSCKKSLRKPIQSSKGLLPAVTGSRRQEAKCSAFTRNRQSQPIRSGDSCPQSCAAQQQLGSPPPAGHRRDGGAAADAEQGGRQGACSAARLGAPQPAGQAPVPSNGAQPRTTHLPAGRPAGLAAGRQESAWPKQRTLLCGAAQRAAPGCR